MYLQSLETEDTVKRSIICKPLSMHSVVFFASYLVYTSDCMPLYCGSMTFTQAVKKKKSGVVFQFMVRTERRKFKWKKREEIYSEQQRLV